jgi:hypothetical protein
MAMERMHPDPRVPRDAKQAYWLHMQIVSDAAVLKRQAKEIERLMRKLEESGYIHNLCHLMQQKEMLCFRTWP